MVPLRLSRELGVLQPEWPPRAHSGLFLLPLPVPLERMVLPGAINRSCPNGIGQRLFTRTSYSEGVIASEVSKADRVAGWWPRRAWRLRGLGGWRWAKGAGASDTAVEGNILGSPVGSGGSQGSSSEGSHQSPILCQRLAPSAVHAEVWLPGWWLRVKVAFLLTVVLCLQPLVPAAVLPSHSGTSLPLTPVRPQPPGVTSPFAGPCSGVSFSV